MYLICQLAPQDHMIEGSCNFMTGNCSFYATTLPSLLAIGIVIAETQCY